MLSKPPNSPATTERLDCECGNIHQGRIAAKHIACPRCGATLKSPLKPIVNADRGHRVEPKLYGDDE